MYIGPDRVNTSFGISAPESIVEVARQENVIIKTCQIAHPKTKI
jgi:hypothetical protein